VTSPVRVVLADDHDLMRDGLSAVLSADARVRIVGEASSGPSALAAVAALAPDVVLMDIEMPGGDGIQATRAIVERFAGTRVLILTMFDLDEYVLEALRAGASGFLLKTTPATELTPAVLACAAGEPTMAPSVTRRLVDSYVRRPVRPGAELPAHLRALTGRELDVLRALARGLSNAEIGRELHLAETTVKTHITRILAKLGLRDRLQAVITAYETGLVPLGTP
jgi:DNA-binding NarL/FixJ family response regulator